MAIRTRTIIAPGITNFGKVIKPRHSDGYGASFFITGTFGGTSLAPVISFDNGASWQVLQDGSGSNVALTAGGNFNITLFVGNSLQDGEAPLIGLQATGGAGININAILSDNKG